MKCPCCNQELELIEPANTHMDRYQKPIHAKTICCGNIVYCEPYVIFEAEESDRDEDSWGNKKD